MEKPTDEQIEYIFQSNQFLQKIATEQTKKIQALQEEIDRLKKLGSDGCSILDTLPEEDIEKLRKAAVEEV
jgi:uncharacterized protein YgbK (DUF1537 family)|tara:strand:+ start:274 stop:486 length:213 start_codon:yes stop_codon:yes gene_type:complete